ncbi:type I restriction-modification system subunit M [Rhodococcoides corynebacterioides]|uniref:type I restriction-modification system subunit M n=1 Tax=Rhodococcoides corynebacterioides TaxID=53972 RepID=UPI0027DEB31C|nr:type I restriction-modification system subunit M [Rhodococcus corynebacterioides]
MALKKSDLYSSLWASCDQLRGGMDASQYKDYILTLLFVKYVSDKAKADSNSLIDVPNGGSFDDMLAAKNDKEIGDKFNKIVAALADANDLRNVIDLADFNDEEKLGKGKEMVDRLSMLVTIFNDLDFRGSRAEGDDLLGDAYEYLMRHFATESGKSKGQFYTPAEVSRILAKVVGIGAQTRQDETVYDPACGSGSLLLKAAAEAPRGMSVYGQEKDNATWALSKMNMILHGNEIAEIHKGDTITSPQTAAGSRLKTFDFVVMNPPFSLKSWNSGLENDYNRFEYGRPPEKNGDYAFLLHALTSLKSTGKGAIILPHGVLFRGNAEAGIRKRLLQHGFIKGIIGLPANLFYGTGIPACIVILDKEDAVGRTGVFMIDASKGFMKDGNKNRLRSQDIHKIVDTFNKRREIERYSRMVPMSEIADPKNDYNLNIPRYIDSSEPEDLQDLHAHLDGGIPNNDLDELAPYWDAFPLLRDQLFKPDRVGYSNPTTKPSDVQQTILNSPEFQKLANNVRALTTDWFATHHQALTGINADTSPNDLIATISDDLLARFKQMPLLDEYDIYEQLMAYWHETMHDDVFLVMREGWARAVRPRKAIEDKDRKLAETADLVTGTGRSAQKYKMDLVPPALIIARYLADDRNEVERLAAIAEEATRSLEDYVEEYAVEDGPLSEAMDDDKISKALATARLRVAKREQADPDEIAALGHVIKLYAAESDAKKAVKDAQAALNLATLAKYGDLTESEVKVLTLDLKWLGDVTERIITVVESRVHLLIARVSQLGRRYAETLASLDERLEMLNQSVVDNLTLLTGESRLPGFSAPWKTMPLSALLSYEQPGRYLVTTTRQLESGRTPVLTAGKTFILGYTNDTRGICTSHPLIIFDDFTTAIQFVDFDFKAKSSAMKLLRARPGVADIRFMYERMQLINFVVGDHKRHWISQYSKIEVTVPELDEQIAIAKTLAQFDDLTAATESRRAKLLDLKRASAQRVVQGAPVGGSDE